MRKRQRIGKRTGQVHFLAALDRGDDQSGEAAGNDDSYDTPDVEFSYNRVGQRLTATQTKPDPDGWTQSVTFAYNDALQLQSETWDADPGAPAYDKIITRKYQTTGDARGRDLGFYIGEHPTPEYGKRPVNHFLFSQAGIGDDGAGDSARVRRALEVQDVGDQPRRDGEGEALAGGVAGAGGQRPESGGLLSRAGHQRGDAGLVEAATPAARSGEAPHAEKNEGDRCRIHRDRPGACGDAGGV